MEYVRVIRDRGTSFALTGISIFVFFSKFMAKNLIIEINKARNYSFRFAVRNYFTYSIPLFTFWLFKRFSVIFILTLQL